MAGKQSNFYILKCRVGCRQFAVWKIGLKSAKMNLTEIEEIIAGFEAGTFPKEQWSHELHFLMALWYLHRFPAETAEDLIKNGIRNYNKKQGGMNTESAGYHETVTEFYIRVLTFFLNNFAEEKEFEQLWKIARKEEFTGKDYIFRFYSKEYLFDKKARKNWCKPDLRPFNFSELSID